MPDVDSSTQLTSNNPNVTTKTTHRASVTKITTHETAVATTTALLKSVDPTKDLNVALRFFETSRSKGKRGREEKKALATSNAKAKRAKMKGNPIIVVPNAMTATINMANAKQFFGNAEYVDSNELRRKDGYKKPKLVEVKRRIVKVRGWGEG